MNREIKFRAWDGKRKEMLYEFPIELATPDGEQFYLNAPVFPVSADYYERELMQFTGLRDKSGVEIYEGDIVKFTTIFGFESELMNEWKEMHGLDTINGIGSLFKGIVVVDMLRGLMLKRCDNEYAEPFFSRHQNIKARQDWDTSEVIGNIYEHPHLLA